VAYVPPGIPWIEDILARIGLRPCSSETVVPVLVVNIQGVAAESELSLQTDFRAYESIGALQNYTLAHPNTTMAGLVFYPDLRHNFTYVFVRCCVGRI
jgi:hypothetical protein